MIIIPNERINRAAILTLKDALHDRATFGRSAKLLKHAFNGNGMVLSDRKGNKMFCLQKGIKFMLHNLNGPAFFHHSNQEILFILDRSYTPTEYSNNFFVKYIRSVQLETPTEPVVGAGIYSLKDDNRLSVSYGDSNYKINLETRNSSHQLHSINGLPAKVNFTWGHSYEWYKDGKKHRIDGPAVIQKLPDVNGTVEYWINGQKKSEKTFEEFFKGAASDEDKDILSDLKTDFD